MLIALSCSTKTCKLEVNYLDNEIDTVTIRSKTMVYLDDNGTIRNSSGQIYCCYVKTVKLLENNT